MATTALVVPFGAESLIRRFQPPDAPHGRRSSGGGAGEDALVAVARLLDLLDTLDPTAAALARGCLPHGDSTFGAGLALFLSVIARGCRDWLGPEAAARLAALDGGLVLDECDRALTPRFHTDASGSWRVLSLPLLDFAAGHRPMTGFLCAIGFESEVNPAFRVVLQAKPLAIGAVQLTATMAGRRLDVALQTAAGFPAPLLAELHETVAAVLGECGLVGALSVGPLAGVWLDLDDDLRSDVAL